MAGFRQVLSRGLARCQSLFHSALYANGGDSLGHRRSRPARSRHAAAIQGDGISSAPSRRSCCSCSASSNRSRPWASGRRFKGDGGRKRNTLALALTRSGSERTRATVCPRRSPSCSVTSIRIHRGRRFYGLSLQVKAESTSRWWADGPGRRARPSNRGAVPAWAGASRGRHDAQSPKPAQPCAGVRCPGSSAVLGAVFDNLTLGDGSVAEDAVAKRRRSPGPMRSSALPRATAPFSVGRGGKRRICGQRRSWRSRASPPAAVVLLDGRPRPSTTPATRRSARRFANACSRAARQLVTVALADRPRRRSRDRPRQGTYRRGRRGRAHREPGSFAALLELGPPGGTAQQLSHLWKEVDRWTRGHCCRVYHRRAWPPTGPTADDRADPRRWPSRGRS